MFWKRLTKQLQTLAGEAGGKVQVLLSLERSNVVASLTPYARVPRSLELFLELHIPRVNAVGERPSASSSWTNRVVERLVQFMTSVLGRTP